MLEDIFSSLYVNDYIVMEITNKIIDENTIADNASPTLLNLRKKINKIGQNINQLTKYANTFNELDKELLLGLADEIDKMKKLVKEEFENKEVRKIKNGRN